MLVLGYIKANISGWNYPPFISWFLTFSLILWKKIHFISCDVKLMINLENVFAKNYNSMKIKSKIDLLEIFHVNLCYKIMSVYKPAVGKLNISSLLVVILTAI